jgi:hypothetical protein
VTYRERLALCEEFHEFEDHTGMRLSETELEAMMEMAKRAGPSISAYFERSLDRVQTAHAKLRSENVTKH